MKPAHCNDPSAFGPLSSMNVCFACDHLRGKGAPGQGCVLHLGGRRCRADCPAMLGLVACRQTHFAHCVRCVQTDGDKSVDEARCARGHEPCASRRLRGALRPTRACLCCHHCGSRSNSTARGSRRAAPGGGDLCGDEKRRLGVGARSALRQLTRRGCLNGANEVSEVSSAARPQAEHRSGVDAKRRPPPHEPPPGTACRAAPRHHSKTGY